MMAADMMRPTAPSQLGSEFNEFLFAPVGLDSNGDFLSLLSALARLNVDPWEEAANLTRLTKESAIERLTSFIANLPGHPAALSGAKTVATRLIALLPSIERHKVTSQITRHDIEDGVNLKSSMPYIIVFFLLAGLAARYADVVNQPTQTPSADATHSSKTPQKESADSAHK